MNTDQISSLLRWGLTAAGGALMSHGWATQAGADELVSGGMALAALVWSMVHHAGPTKKQLANGKFD